MNVIILDDYQDAVRKLRCASKLNDLQAKGLPMSQVVTEGAQRRLRPVLMTAAITAAALIQAAMVVACERFVAEHPHEFVAVFFTGHHEDRHRQSLVTIHDVGDLAMFEQARPCADELELLVIAGRGQLAGLCHRPRVHDRDGLARIQLRRQDQPHRGH